MKTYKVTFTLTNYDNTRTDLVRFTVRANSKEEAKEKAYNECRDTFVSWYPFRSRAKEVKA